MIRKFQAEDQAQARNNLEAWQKEYNDARDAYEQLELRNALGKLTDEKFEKFKAPYVVIIDRTESVLNKSRVYADRRLELATAFFSGSVNIRETFEIANDDEKRRILLEIGSNWTLSNKKVRFTPRMPYDLLVNRTSDTVWRDIGSDFRTIALF